jgi:hypothetical protein
LESASSAFHNTGQQWTPRAAGAGRGFNHNNIIIAVIIITELHTTYVLFGVIKTNGSAK